VIYYITCNDVPNGIFQSQVIDVVKTLTELTGEDVRLVSFIPRNGFIKNKQEILKELPNAKVYPILFGLLKWKKLKGLLKLVTKRKSSAICRGPLATELALGLFEKVVYDGRAAVKSEIEEFDVTGNKYLDSGFIVAEKNAILKSDFRIAVSNKLVEYWRSNFKYESDEHVIIPCTLSSKHSLTITYIEKTPIIKIVYSGGVGGWQSFDLITTFLSELMSKQDNVHALFLTKPHDRIDNMISTYPDRCESKWIEHEAVFSELEKCDFGLLIRDENGTNAVASPVKFAEYLNAGLKVIISNNLGDFTEFVQENDCGEVISDEKLELSAVSFDEKSRMNQLAQDSFSKESEEIKQLYLTLIQTIK
jgi:hypothetical protein